MTRLKIAKPPKRPTLGRVHLCDWMNDEGVTCAELLSLVRAAGMIIKNRQWPYDITDGKYHPSTEAIEVIEGITGGQVSEWMWLQESDREPAEPPKSKGGRPKGSTARTAAGDGDRNGTGPDRGERQSASIDETASKIKRRIRSLKAKVMGQKKRLKVPGGKPRRLWQPLKPLTKD